MFDTVEMILTNDKVPTINFLTKPSKKLLNVNIHRNEINPSVFSITGNLSHFKVSLNEHRIKLTGSLCKFYHGNNFNTLTREETKISIDKLSELLDLPMYLSEITRIDFGTNFEMKYDFSVYMNRLGILNKHQRLEQTRGLYYNNSVSSKNVIKKLVFYDKIAEYRAKGEYIPKEYLNKSFLRYEIRFLKQLLKQFNLSELSAEKLYDEKFFNFLVKRWKDEYFKIKKINDKNKFDFSKVSSLSQFNQQGLISLINNCGGEIKILKGVSEAQKNGMTKKLAFDIKKKIKEAAISELFTSQNDFITELDKKISII